MFLPGFALKCFIFFILTINWSSMQYITTVYVTTVPNQRNELWLNFNTTYFTINSGNCAQVEGACLTDYIRGKKTLEVLTTNQWQLSHAPYVLPSRTNETPLWPVAKRRVVSMLPRYKEEAVRMHRQLKTESRVCLESLMKPKILLRVSGGYQL